MTSLLQDAAVVPEPGMTLRQLRDLAVKKVRKKDIKQGTSPVQSDGTIVLNSVQAISHTQNDDFLPGATALNQARSRLIVRNARRERHQPTPKHAQFMFTVTYAFTYTCLYAP